MQNKITSLHSSQVPIQFFPGMKLSMKNNVRSSRNKPLDAGLGIKSAKCPLGPQMAQIPSALFA